jgi:hypothetical protein
VDADGTLDPTAEDLDGDNNLDDGEPYVDVDSNGIYNAPIPAVLGDDPSTPLVVETDFELEAAVPGDTFTDINGNGVYDSAEVDVNGNGVVDLVETFEDTNTNGVYDEGEAFTDALNGEYDLGETFVDLNGNGSWDAGEQFTDALNGVYDEGEEFVDAGNGVYDVQEWVDAPENENGAYDLGEAFVDTNQNGVWDDAVIGDDPSTLLVVETDFVITPAEPFTDSLLGVFDPAFETWTDNDGDGVIDSAEAFVDSDDNGQWDPYTEDFDLDEAFDLVNEDLDGDANLDIAEDVDGDDIMDVTVTLAWEELNGVYDLGEDFVDANENGVWDDFQPAVLGDNPETPEVETDFELSAAVPAEAFTDGTPITDLEITAGNTVNIAAPNFTHNDVDVIDANELAAITDPMIADIATNAADIATNAADIATNAGNIATNTADIATNAADIATNAAGIATNAADIAINVSDIAVNRDGIAMAAAISHSTILPGMTQALDISHASFEGSSAMSINYSRKVKEGVQINLSHASAGDSHINKVGVGFQW